MRVRNWGRDVLNVQHLTAADINSYQKQARDLVTLEAESSGSWGDR